MPEIKVYHSSFSSSSAAAKQAYAIFQMLDGRSIEYQKFDICIDEEAKDFLKNNKEENDKGIVLPQLWVDEKCLGRSTDLFDQLTYFNDEGAEDLKKFLQ